MSLKSVKDIIQEFNLQPKKSLGQNFLVDQSITDRIVLQSQITPQDYIIEIGPGPGLLTRSILKYKPKKLLLIEKDERFKEPILSLQEFFPDTEIEFINVDALEFDFDCLPQDVKVLANLPYNVASQILISLIKNHKKVSSMTLMFQKEVAQRIVANPGSKTFGRLSVMAACYYKSNILFHIAPRLFFPPPKIVSSVVFLERMEQPKYAGNFEKLEMVIFKLFNNRRKQIGKVLEELGVDKNLIEKLGHLRPEQVSVDDLTKCVNQTINM